MTTEITSIPVEFGNVFLISIFRGKKRLIFPGVS
jgi:hypothetical protein